MNFIKTDLKDLILIEPTIYGDGRGYFFEAYNQKSFQENIGNFELLEILSLFN